MRRVGITQRQTILAERNEIRDALDTRLTELLWGLGFCPVPLANAVADVTGYLAATGIEALVLSGGDDLGVTPQRDIFERGALAVAERQGMPVLGICRGLQLINDVCGGTLVPVEGHVAVRHSLYSSQVAVGKTVNSYHRLAITLTTLAAPLVPLAQAHDGTVEAVRHQNLPWTAIMWHPERDMPVDDADAALVSAALHGDVAL
jgi:putative glutamine amidotransferase